MKKLFLIVIVLFLAACQPAQVVATSTRQPATEAQPAATEAPTVAPTESLHLFATTRNGKGADVNPGAYELPSWYEIPLKIEVPSGWRYIHQKDQFVFGLVKGKNSLGDVSSWLGFMPIYDEDADTFFEKFRSSPGLEEIGDPMDVTLAGLYPATQLDMLALPNPDYPGDPAAGIPPGTQILQVLINYTTPGDPLDFVWTTMTAEARIRIFKVQIGDRTAIIYIEAPQADFDQFLMDADGVLSTMSVRSD